MLPRREDGVTARVEAQYLPADKEIQIVSRTDHGDARHRAAGVGCRPRCLWNGLALENLKEAGLLGALRAKGTAARGEVQVKQRCGWARGDQYIAYHDEEWGVPLHDDRALFELLILEGAQAGLSWSTILNKRENYRKAFDRFDAKKVARYDDAQGGGAAGERGIVRNRLKIECGGDQRQGIPGGAEGVRQLRRLHLEFRGRQADTESLEGQTCRPAPRESDAMSKDLQKRGFTFVGSTICYAFMQATGMVNDHLVTCFRHAELS